MQKEKETERILLRRPSAICSLATQQRRKPRQSLSAATCSTSSSIYPREYSPKPHEPCVYCRSFEPNTSQPCIPTKVYCSCQLCSPVLRSVSEVDATAVHYLFDLVGSNRDQKRLDPETKLEVTRPVTVLLANPSAKVVHQLEEADLINFVRAPLTILRITTHRI